LKLEYDDVPEITRVDGKRTCSGKTTLTISGKGFGFDSLGIEVTVKDLRAEEQRQNLQQKLCVFPQGCANPQMDHYLDSEIPTVHFCHEVQIFHDETIRCAFEAKNLSAELVVTVATYFHNPPLFSSLEFLPSEESCEKQIL
jgi:hypothetical protein